MLNVWRLKQKKGRLLRLTLDVEKYIIAICREIGEDGLSNASAALLVLLEETIEMLSWDEADLPSRESLTWE